MFIHDGGRFGNRTLAPDVIRQTLPTIAEPAWFAPLVDYQEHEDHVTLVLLIDGGPKLHVRVESNGKNLFVWGSRKERVATDAPPRPLMRVFALPFEVLSHSLQTSRADDLLRVRIAKKVAPAVRSDDAQAA